MSAEPKSRKISSSFKTDSLNETAVSATPTCHDDQHVYLCDIYVYDENKSVTFFIAMMLWFSEDFEVEKSGAMMYGRLVF